MFEKHINHPSGNIKGVIEITNTVFNTKALFKITQKENTELKAGTGNESQALQIQW